MTALRRTLAVAGLGLLAACGNGTNDAAKLLAQLPAALSGEKQQEARVTPQQLAQALGATDASVHLYEIEERKAQFLMFDIQRNGPYQSFGASSRQVIVMRDGMIVSTRGFGGDLMSSEEDALISLVKARQAGSAQYVQRFLTSDNQTRVVGYSCIVAPAGGMQVTVGLIDEPAQTVNAKCSGPGGTFSNTFVVAHDGYILSARQWMGEVIGYMATQAIRR
ncbi:YjbF family lipoprotein [Pseudoponticoccus marisrubri]|uniref:YjbF family lipoprotein n=1 Tax=Pseudoponticoccus marisrubri TaxID=1685382 RepID=A0A0W7WG99_9RHOB|nr:YjbF family lipoprotein [Pseudoponticoccus marisrubri]KUF09586.1 hypothetical protein AVJ23_17045 [Pseudoponticoccus marisrubri]